MKTAKAHVRAKVAPPFHVITRLNGLIPPAMLLEKPIWLFRLRQPASKSRTSEQASQPDNQANADCEPVSRSVKQTQTALPPVPLCT